jgi:hypothetical protein
LTQIYGEEDWEATIEKVKEDGEELDTAALLNIAKVHPPS